MQITSILLSVFLGIGLASATGFRIFLPLFVLSVAAHFQMLTINQNFAFVGNLTALLVLGVAMIVEILAYYIPFIDNILDVVATPLAAIAGTFVMASTLVDFSPVATWSLAIIAGGGTATAFQGMTTVTRMASTAKTAGIGNPILATAETGTSVLLSVSSLFLPIVTFVIVLVLLVILTFVLKKFKKRLKNSIV